VSAGAAGGPAPVGPGAEAFKAVLGRFATGVTVVTATTAEGPVGFTCQAFTSLSLQPPLVALAPAKGSTSWPRIAQAGAFCVNVLAAGQEELCRRFATPAEPPSAKFDGVAFERAPSGAPLLGSVLAWVDCRLVVVHDAGDHELVVGEVRALGVGQGEPLLYYRGRFGRFLAAEGEPPGPLGPSD
jgi:3-hydroxy-9,10-secoandrosta-1,3,5(10)-triene-9,17-dione monooxygenase reductase component